jgi:hypothetical protein
MEAAIKALEKELQNLNGMLELCKLKDSELSKKIKLRETKKIIEISSAIIKLKEA